MYLPLPSLVTAGNEDELEIKPKVSPFATPAIEKTFFISDFKTVSVPLSKANLMLIIPLIISVMLVTVVHFLFGLKLIPIAVGTIEIVPVVGRIITAESSSQVPPASVLVDDKPVVGIKELLI